MKQYEVIEKMAKTLLELSEKIKEISYVIEFQEQVLAKTLERIRTLEGKKEDSLN